MFIAEVGRFIGGLKQLPLSLESLGRRLWLRRGWGRTGDLLGVFRDTRLSLAAFSPFNSGGKDLAGRNSFLGMFGSHAFFDRRRFSRRRFLGMFSNRAFFSRRRFLGSMFSYRLFGVVFGGHVTGCGLAPGIIENIDADAQENG